jgi:hypothetical protein
MGFLVSVLVLLLSTTFFCWVMTADLGLGPLCHLFAFFGGMTLIGLAGVASLKLSVK